MLLSGQFKIVYGVYRRTGEYLYMAATLPDAIQISASSYGPLFIQRSQSKIQKYATRADWRMAVNVLETFQGQKNYFLFALEQNQKALKYFHTNSVELKLLFPAQKGQVPIFFPSERLILPKGN